MFKKDLITNDYKLLKAFSRNDKKNISMVKFNENLAKLNNNLSKINNVLKTIADKTNKKC